MSYDSDTEDTISNAATEAAAGYIAGRATAAVEAFEVGDEDHFAAVPHGVRLESLRPFEDERLEAPRRRSGTARLTTLDSLVEHIRRFMDAESIVFAIDDRSAPRLLAIYDYHESKTKEINSPRFGVHRGEYRFPLSDEWNAWNELASSKGITQGELAAFLEDHLESVLDPKAVGENIDKFATTYGITLAGAARLTLLARSLSVHVEQKVVSAQNPDTGEARIVFEESHADDAGGPVKIPGGFAIAIPVFRSGPLYRIPVRLRYRVSRGAVTFTITPHGLDRVFDDAFNEAAAKVGEDTNLPVLFGTPEVEPSRHRNDR